MRKHTTTNLDMGLVREAAAVLGTSSIAATVHQALAEVVRRHRRMAILDLRPNLGYADLERMRSHRFVEER